MARSWSSEVKKARPWGEGGSRKGSGEASVLAVTWMCLSCPICQRRGLALAGDSWDFAKGPSGTLYSTESWVGGARHLSFQSRYTVWAFCLGSFRFGFLGENALEDEKQPEKHCTRWSLMPSLVLSGHNLIKIKVKRNGAGLVRGERGCWEGRDSWRVHWGRRRRVLYTSRMLERNGLSRVTLLPAFEEILIIMGLDRMLKWLSYCSINISDQHIVHFKLTQCSTSIRLQ